MIATGTLTNGKNAFPLLAQDIGARAMQAAIDFNGNLVQTYNQKFTF
jgi:hypothetical protein